MMTSSIYKMTKVLNAVVICVGVLLCELAEGNRLEELRELNFCQDPITVPSLRVFENVDSLVHNIQARHWDAPDFRRVEVYGQLLQAYQADKIDEATFLDVQDFFANTVGVFFY